MAKTLLVTGSSGLIGSEVCAFFAAQGFVVHGVDNNQRATFFGPQGDTRWNQQRLLATLKARAAEAKMPTQRFIRVLIEAQLSEGGGKAKRKPEGKATRAVARSRKRAA